MSTRSTPTRSTAALALADGALATTTIFVTAQQRANTQSPAVPPPPMVFTGCLEKPSDAADVSLLRVAPPATAGTSAAAGTSASGDGPSGQLTAHGPETEHPRTGATGTSGSAHPTTSATSIPTIAVTSVTRPRSTCPR